MLTPKQETALLEDIRDIKLAVLGNKDLGVSGLVNDVSSLKMWRLQIDGRILLISGFITGVVFLLKYLYLKIS